MNPVILEVGFRGARRRVRVELGPVEYLPARGSHGRRLLLESEASGVETRLVVEPAVSWETVTAHADLLLTFEADFTDRLARGREVTA